MTSAPRTGRARRDVARIVADDHGGVASRALLRAVGVDRHGIRREVEAERWALHGTQTVAVHTRDLGPTARRWRAVWEVGVRVAALDGVTALQHAGMSGFEDDTVHVSVRHTASVASLDGVVVHKIVRRTAGEVLEAGIPRVRPPIAAVRAAHWAVSDRQAALLLVLPVQQRLCTGGQLLAAAARVRGRTRRRFVRTVVADIADGAHSLGELDVVAQLRRRGLPEPDRQVVRLGPNGRCYLDLWWKDARLAVEVDGAGHLSGLQMVDDSLRQNAIALGDDLVLRVGLLGWRLTPQAYLDQIVAAYWQRVGLSRVLGRGDAVPLTTRTYLEPAHAPLSIPDPDRHPPAVEVIPRR